MDNKFLQKLSEAEIAAQQFLAQAAKSPSPSKFIYDDGKIVSGYYNALDLAKIRSPEEKEGWLHIADYYLNKALVTIPELKNQMAKHAVSAIPARELDVIIKAMTGPLDDVIEIKDLHQQAYINKRNEMISKFHAELARQNIQVQAKSGGCYIATAVYGSYECPQVWALRRYRDNCLSRSMLGNIIIQLYYGSSPLLVKWFGNTKGFNLFWQWLLNLIVEKLKAKGYADTPYIDRTL